MRRNTSTRYVGRLTEYNTLTGNTWGRVLVFAQVNRPGASRAKGGMGTMKTAFFGRRCGDKQRMRTCFAVVALASIVLSGCGGYSNREGKAVERLKEQLLDPEAAQFRNVHEGVERKGGWIVCGEVNAKNKMGGYIGFRKFVMTEKEGDVMFADESTAEGMLASVFMQKICHFRNGSK